MPLGCVLLVPAIQTSRVCNNSQHMDMRPTIDGEKGVGGPAAHVRAGGSRQASGVHSADSPSPSSCVQLSCPDLVRPGESQ